MKYRYGYTVISELSEGVEDHFLETLNKTGHFPFPYPLQCQEPPLSILTQCF